MPFVGSRYSLPSPDRMLDVDYRQCGCQHALISAAEMPTRTTSLTWRRCVKDDLPTCRCTLHSDASLNVCTRVALEVR